MARILVCKTCGTAQRLRDFNGSPNDAQYEDVELLDAIATHLGKAADPRPESHESQLMRVDDADLELLDDESLRNAISNELDIELSEIRDDYKEQAMQCYNLHMRPKGGCIDWCTESRAIGRTKGVSPKNKSYLCYFCPVNSWVEDQKNIKSGMFDKYKWR